MYLSSYVVDTRYRKDTKDSQSLLPEYQHKEVDEISRNNVEEKDEQVVYKFAAAYVTVRVPNLPLKRVLTSNLFTLLQYFSPRNGQRATLSDIVYRYTFRPGERHNVM